MTMLYCGLAIFFGVHLYSAFRSRAAGTNIEEKIGQGRYKGIYSLISFVGIILIVLGYAKAEATPYIFSGFSGARSANLVIMLPALIMIVAANMPTGYIKAITRHPMLIAVILWAAVHLLDGANLKQFLLFGSFLLYSVVDIFAVSIKNRSQVKDAKEPKIKNDVIAVVIGLLVYLVSIYWLHAFLFGFKPLV